LRIQCRRTSSWWVSGIAWTTHRPARTLATSCSAFGLVANLSS
jgi:hypothetical protein